MQMKQLMNIQAQCFTSKVMAISFKSFEIIVWIMLKILFLLFRFYYFV